MSIQRPDFRPVAQGGDNPTAAFVKLDANDVDLDARKLDKAGGTVTGDVFINGRTVAAGGYVQAGSDAGNYARMDYQGRVTRSVSANPTANASTLAHSVTGAFGGGYLIIDGNNAIGLYSTSGNLNIGTGSATGALTTRMTLGTNGNLTITGQLTQSDYRLKHEVEEIDPEHAYLAVLQVRPIRYVRIDSPESERRVTNGILAHELAVPMPNLVIGAKDGMGTVDVYNDEGQVVGQNPVPVFQTVDYNGISIEMAAAFKHVDAQLRAQAATIESLMERLAVVEAG